VLRVLINQAHIERTFLAPKRIDADNLLRSVRGGGMAWSADFMRVQKFPYVVALLYILFVNPCFFLQRGRRFVHKIESGARQWGCEELAVHWQGRCGPVEVSFTLHSRARFGLPIADRNWQDELRNAEHALQAATEKYHRLRQAFAACQQAVSNLDVSFQCCATVSDLFDIYL